VAERRLCRAGRLPGNGGHGLVKGRSTVAEQPALSFAALLRQLRIDARLTQEELAEAAGLSPRSVSDLERGIHRTARKDTAGLLADALGIAGAVRVSFVAAARGRAPAAEVLATGDGAAPGMFAAAATRALPRDISGFTGRQAELVQLLGRVDALAAGGGVVGIHAIGGMAGIGKTTFAVHAAHRLGGRFPDGQFFLPLHAHTRGQRPVDPADGLASLLLTAGVAASNIPSGLEARASRWRDHVAGKKILLLLDDAAGHEQVRPLLPGTVGSLVLITSRRRLTALEDAAVISLETLSPGEAAALLARLADRPDLGSDDGPAGEITRLCGYLPLAIAMLAAQLRHHPARAASGLAARLASASDRLAEMRAENLSVAAAFDLSYQDLNAGPQRLFRRLGQVPGPSIDAYAAAALDGTGLDDAGGHLDELYNQHLLTEPASGRYQLHDLLREHARALAAADNSAESGAAEARLLNYYAHTATVAARHIPTSWTVQGRPPPGGPPSHAPELSTQASAAAWLNAERPNLHAAVDYAAASGLHMHAAAISAAVGEFLRNDGHWDQSAALHRSALAVARRAGDRHGQAVALNELGLLAWLTGDYPAAAASLGRAVALHGDLDDRLRQAYALNHLGFVQALTGDYPASVASHRHALVLTRDLGDHGGEADSLVYLGYAQQMTGDYAAAASNLARALELSRGLGKRLVEASALNILGTLQTLTGDYAASTANLRQSLNMFRDLGNRSMHAWAINDLGVVQQLTGDYAAAAASHQQALQLFRDLGARLGVAEALNNLGDLAIRTSATQRARDHHAQALAIARELGVPLEEARALEGIGNSHRLDGNPAEAASHLRQALTLYQRIGTTGIERVEETLRSCRL
jgi:tetratricopeptide (TPR) repeat protein/transcriptional regulator with XRE-family HTH domain